MPPLPSPNTLVRPLGAPVRCTGPLTPGAAVRSHPPAHHGRSVFQRSLRNPRISRNRRNLQNRNSAATEIATRFGPKILLKCDRRETGPKYPTIGLDYGYKWYKSSFSLNHKLNHYDWRIACCTLARRLVRYSYCSFLRYSCTGTGNSTAGRKISYWWYSTRRVSVSVSADQQISSSSMQQQPGAAAAAATVAAAAAAPVLSRRSALLLPAAAAGSSQQPCTASGWWLPGGAAPEPQRAA
jgi:hypothetical protein